MDFLPDEMAQRRYVETIFRETFESFGFQEVQTPIFEEFALFEARSGEEIRDAMFTFTADEVEYALRPELTAAICRMIATGKLTLPKPYKLYYIGPCFRYEEPQAGRYRQFWQAGIELMGSDSPAADAEVITVGATVLKEAGAEGFVLKIGNIGIMRGILDTAHIDTDQQNQIIGNIDSIMSTREKCTLMEEKENLDTDDESYIKTYLNILYDMQMELVKEGIDDFGQFEIMPSSMETIPRWVQDLPLAMEKTYTAFWMNQGIPEDTIDLILQVSRMQGTRQEVMPQAQALLQGTVVESALQELNQVLDYVEAFGITSYQVVLGVARGLDYYTGTVFEFDFPLLGAQKQVCGGGRYDVLVEEFGGPPTKATGFAFGFDRVVLSRMLVKDIPVPGKVDVFIAIIKKSLLEEAVRLSQDIRKAGYQVEIEMLGRDLKGQLGYASDIGARYAAIMGPKELKEGKVMLKNLQTEEQTPVLLEDIVNQLG
jgi:histidyl-tRNA synthetase